MTTTRTFIISAFAAATVALTAGAAFAEHHFVGTWKTKDGDGKDFKIDLAKDGSASGDRGGEALKGKWAEKDGAVVINWGDGWKTKIVKDGDHYKKIGYEKDKEKGTSPAEKVK